MEESKRLPILRDTRESLLRKSGGRCAFPKCNKKIIDENGRLKGEVCHIEAAMQGGERFNPNMTNEERRDYDNLILLCFDHHEETNDERSYTLEVLKAIKKAHEQNVSKSINLIGTYLKTSSSDDSHSHEINEERIKDALELFSKREEFLAFKKPAYNLPPNYIERSVYYLNSPNQEAFFDRKSYSLVDLVRKKKRITILGIAGSGKSIELNHLAYQCSLKTNLGVPIKVRLNSFTRTEGVQQLLELEFPDFRKFKDQNLLIILDALDEVAPENIGEAVKQIENLGTKLPHSTIVVSCRNNFYSIETSNRDSRIKGFDSYALNHLTDFDIDNYCTSNLGDFKHEFVKQLEKRKLYDQLRSPFYLVHLIEFYKTDGRLPKSRTEIFEFLIKLRFEKDRDEKYNNHGLKLEEYQNSIRERIQRLAIAAESLQRNYLEDHEFRLLVPEPNEQALITYTFLFDKNKNGSWEFHHNNFQEYLAAKNLSVMPLNHIKKFISFGPEHKKIKPSWVNTLSFLIDLLSPQERRINALLKWIISNEKDVLVRFEKEHIDLKIRERIFKKIYTEFESKKILMNSEKFDLYELAGFVSDSELVVKFLLEKSIKLVESWKKAEAIRILPHLEFSKNHLTEIQELILSLIIDPKIENDFKLGFFYALRDLKIYSEKLTQNILKNVDLGSSQYLRAGFYAYLYNSEEGDRYQELIVNGIDKIKEVQVTFNTRETEEENIRETRLSDESYNLEKLVEKFTYIELTKSLLSRAQKLDELNNDQLNFEISAKAIQNSIKLTPKYPELYKEVLNLLIILSRQYSKELSKDLNEYFSKTNTSLKAFNELRTLSKDLLDKDSSVNYFYALGVVATQKCVDSLLDQYKKGDLEDEVVFKFLNVFGWENRELYDSFYKEINLLSNNKFTYLERNWKQEKLDKYNNDINILLDKERFKSMVIEVFNEASVSSFTHEELWDLRKKSIKEGHSNNNIILTTLREEAKRSVAVTKDSISKEIDNEERWYWFQINKVLEIDKKNEKFEFDDKTKYFLTGWLEDALEKSNFKTAVFSAKNNGIKYRYLEHYVPYISYRLDYLLDEKVYLGFLYLIPTTIPQKVTKSNTLNSGEKEILQPLTPRKINEYVVGKIGFEKVREKIIENIESRELIDFHQKYNHCNFCSQYQLREGLPLIKELIQEPGNIYEKRSLIEWYIDLTDNHAFIEDLIESFDNETRFEALEKLLAVKNDFAEDYCVKKANSVDDENLSFRFISILARNESKKAFDIYKNWIKSNKRIPDNIHGQNNPRGNNVEDYFEIFEDAMQNDYGKGRWNNRNSFIELMVDLGSKDVESFKKVKLKFESWIRKYDLKFLYYQIQKLELEYYSRVSESLSIEQVIDKLEEYKSDRGSILNRIFELKPNIAGIGLNLNEVIRYFSKRRP